MNYTPKEIYNRLKFQDKVIEAVEILAAPVKSTLGPDGVPIAIQRDGLPPLITKDGVTVANAIFVEDQALNVIIESIKEAAMNTNEMVGDGTTTAILLTEAIIKHSQIYLQTGAITPQLLADSLLSVATKLAENIEKQAIAVKTVDDNSLIKNIAYVSCNGDSEISNIVVEAIDKVGVDGSITLGEGLGKTSLEIEEGFAIESGFSALGANGRILITNQALQQVIYEKTAKKPVAVVVYDGTIDDVLDFGAMLNNVNCGGQNSVPMVVFAHDFSAKVMEVVVVNAARMGLKCLLVKIPRLGTTFSQSQVCEDVAILTGAQIVKPGISKLSDLKSQDSEYLGACEKIVATSKQTTIFGGMGAEDEIAQRSQAIDAQIREATSQFDREVLKERKGRLAGGLAVIRVGAQTDLEMKEKKDRIEDALNATRAAIVGGIIPGGGTALLLAYENLKREQNYNEISKEIKISIDIFEKVCESSVRQIIANGGKTSADVVLDKLFFKFKTNKLCGFNARKNQIEDDMVAAGVIDPARVVMTALLNAASIATTLVRSGGAIVFKPQSTKKDSGFFINGDQ